MTSNPDANPHIVEIYTHGQDSPAITRVCDSMDEALAISDSARHAKRVEIIVADKMLMVIEVSDARVRGLPEDAEPHDFVSHADSF